MQAAVCVKQVPDADAAARLDPLTGRLVRTGPLELDGADAAAVALAVDLVGRAGGAVTAVSMAPAGAGTGLRRAVALGATRAVLVSDEALAGSDALVTARVLAAVLAGLDVDVVVAGTESSDGYSGLVPYQVAELLGWPAVSAVRQAGVRGSSLVARCQGDGGLEEVTCPLPAVLTALPGGGPPVLPTYRALRAARAVPVEVRSLRDLGLVPGQVGGAGARQGVVAVGPGPARPPGERLVDDGQAHVRILEVLAGSRPVAG